MKVHETSPRFVQFLWNFERKYKCSDNILKIRKYWSIFISYSTLNYVKTSTSFKMYVLFHHLAVLQIKRWYSEQSYRSCSTTCRVVENINIGLLNKIIAMFDACGVQYHVFKKVMGECFAEKLSVSSHFQGTFCIK